MRVSKDNGLYIVSWTEEGRPNPKRWATAAKLEDGSWYVNNETMRPIKATGALGKKIVSAVEDYLHGVVSRI
jgi:hypothetical protein